MRANAFHITFGVSGLFTMIIGAAVLPWLTKKLSV